MKYIIFFSVLLLIFLLYAHALPMTIVNEPFDSLTKIKRDKAISDAKSGGFKSGFVETGAHATENNSKKDKNSTKSKNTDKLDYSKGLGNLNVQYHDSPEKIAKDERINLETVLIPIYDPIKEKVIIIKRPAIQNSATYYEYGTYKYGASKYVPNYTESVLLSKSNNYFTGNPTAPPKFSFYDINAADSGVSKYTPGT